MFYNKNEIAEEVLQLMTTVLKVLYTKDASSTSRALFWAAEWLNRTAEQIMPRQGGMTDVQSTLHDTSAATH